MKEFRISTSALARYCRGTEEARRYIRSKLREVGMDCNNIDFRRDFETGDYVYTEKVKK
jgi:hypothetical protein